MTIALYLAFLAVTIVFCATPGPAVMLVSAQALSRGFAGGLRAVAGVQAAAAFYWTASAFGLTALLIASATAFTIVKFVGAAYLIVLGVLSIRNARRKAAVMEREPPLWRAPFAQGLVGNLANPKAVLFYIALLPQFVTIGTASPATFALLAVSAIVIDSLTLTLYALFAAHSRQWVHGVHGLIWRERLVGVVQIAVGGLLAGLRRGAT